MTKKLLLLSLVCLFAGVQMTSAKLLRFGIKGGVNIASMDFSNLPANFSTSNITGFNVGPMLELNPLPLTGLGFEAAALYAQKGFETNNAKYKTSNIDIPLSVKWKFGLPILKVYLMAGPYFSFGLGNSTDTKIMGVTIPTLDTHAMNIGGNVGAGVEIFKRVQVGVNYMYGFTNAYALGKMEVSQYEGKDRILNISAAVLF